MDFENRRRKPLGNRLRRLNYFILLVPVFSLVSGRILRVNIPILREEAIYREFLFRKIVESLFFKCFILKIEGSGPILSFLTSISTVLYSTIYARSVNITSFRALESLSIRLCYASREEYRVLRRFQESLF